MAPTIQVRPRTSCLGRRERWIDRVMSNRRYDPKIHHRRSIRLKGYDYSLPGTYFATIVVQDRVCLFGHCEKNRMRLNEVGRMVAEEWEDLPRRFPDLELGPFVVMPNHIHGLIDLVGNMGAPFVCVGARADHDPASGGEVSTSTRRATTRVAPTLGSVVGAFKSLTTVQYIRGVRTRGWIPFRGRLWQRNYFEEIVWDDEALERIDDYILENPANWPNDPENPMKAAGRHGGTGRGAPFGRPDRS